MFKKFTLKKRILIFVLLLAIILIFQYFDKKKGDRTFKDVLVRIESEKITSILMYPQNTGHQEIKLTKTAENTWIAESENIKAATDTQAISAILNEIKEIKSIRLAATDKSKWATYQVDDSLGSRAKIMENDKVVADVVFGKFFYNQSSRNGNYYLRLSDEENVYAAEGFTGISFNQPFASFRNKKIISDNKENWNSISFTYPADSSFALTKENNKWTTTIENADSLKIENYLNRIADKSNFNFVNDFNASGKTPIYKMIINGNNQSEPIVIQAFEADTLNKFIIHSSINPDAYFSGAKEDLVKNIFIGKSELTAIPDKKKRQ